MVLLESEHICERECRADISIHNEKGLRTPSHNLVPEVINAPCGAQSRILLQVSTEEERTQLK